MPFAPTDPAAAAASYPWGAPTAGDAFDFEQLRMRRPVTSERSRFSSTLPRSAQPYIRPRMSRPRLDTYSSMAVRDTRSRTRSTAASSARGGTVTKPFSTYRAPSTLSPYLDLFRRDTSVSADNYNTLVRPQLEQQRTNQRMRSALHGLQGTSQTQGAAIQNIGRQTGVAGPQRYMNYGGYYPNAGR